MGFKRLFLCFGIVVLPLVLAFGQDGSLTKEQVIKMSKAGLADDVIITRIKAEPVPMKLSTDDLITLKSSGVSDNVIRAMMAPASSASAPGAAAAPAADAVGTSPDDPNSPHDPGVYLYSTDRDGKPKMTFIDRVGAGREKTSNMLGAAFTYGIVKAKVKAEVPGARAVVRTPDSRPVFYMYFPSMANATSLGGTDAITSPTQFTLLTLEKKKDHRETSIAKMGFASASAGNDSKKIIMFKSERIRPYVYKLTPEQNLLSDEYAFIASTRMAGSAQGATVVIYDFGVDAR